LLGRKLLPHLLKFDFLAVPEFFVKILVSFSKRFISVGFLSVHTSVATVSLEQAKYALEENYLFCNV